MKASVAARLGLPDHYGAWLSELEAGGPPPDPLVLPDESQMRELLTSVRADPKDAAEVLSARPDPQRHPGLWWLLERCYHRLIRRYGEAPLDDWLELPAALGPVGRCLYAYVFLAAVAGARQWHCQHGVPDPVSWETLSVLGESMADYRPISSPRSTEFSACSTGPCWSCPQSRASSRRPAC